MSSFHILKFSKKYVLLILSFLSVLYVILQIFRSKDELILLNSINEDIVPIIVVIIAPIMPYTINS